MVGAISITLVVLCALASIGPVHSVKFAKLHHRMTKREINKYFGVDSHEEVPQYDVATPFLSDLEGKFLSYKLHHPSPSRRKRSTHSPGILYVKVRALGLNLHLNLSRAKGPAHRNLVVETNNKNGTTTYSRPPETIHYHGHVVSQPGSTVALSNNGALTGMINLLGQLLFLNPLPSYLAKNYGSPGGGQPHIIHRHPINDKGMNKRMGCQLKEFETRSKRSQHDSRRRRRSAENQVSSHKTLEVAMIADEYAVKQHGNRSVADFLLMLAHIVDRLFQDESVGNTKIQLVVTKLLIKDEGFGYKRDDSTMDKIVKLSGWGVRNIPLDPGHRGHADVLVLVTAGNKGGLARKSSVCITQFGRTVSGYIGLGTALIIAHEVAHAMGVRHDGGRPDCPNEDFLMSTGVPGGKQAMTWSPCSREDLQEFLGGSSSTCLDDYPQEKDIVHLPRKFHNKLPGQMYDAETQCKMQFGSRYFHCKQLRSNCGSLYCSRTGHDCLSVRAPPMEGTRCGERHWCISGECVDDGSPMTDGGWSEWSEYTECSRSCGGGLQWKSRTCTNPTPQAGGKECEGSTRGFWRICNPQDCPAGNKLHRLEQCEAQEKGFSIFWYSDPCRLACRKGSMVHLHGRVQDGTKCSSEKNNKNVCIEGRCRSVGCDSVLQSGITFDRCGVCGGDSSSCHVVKDEYTKNWDGFGPWDPDKIIDISKGSVDIQVRMKAESKNLLGVKNRDGNWVYNVGYTWSTVVQTAGTKVAYDHEAYLYKDKVIIKGPLEDTLTLMYVYLGSDNPGVKYSFFSPSPSKVTTDDVRWNVTSWGACSEPCAGGFQSRSVQCRRKDDGSWVNDNLCKQTTKKPISERECNKHPCPADWFLSNWRPCSQTCGKGTQLRQLTCRRKVAMGTYEERPVEECKKGSKPKGLLSRPCNKVACHAEWVPSKWSKCSEECGPDGVMKRTLSCKRLNEEGAYESVPSIQCKHATKLSTEEPCNTDISCPNAITAPDGKKFVPLGCYRDYSGYHALPELVDNLRNTIDWYNMKKTVQECAEKVSSKNITYQVFGVQFYGECWSGNKADETYAEYGGSKNCWQGVGGSHANFVYTFL